MTLVEVMVTLCVALVAVGTTLGAATSLARLEEGNREQTLACLAARRQLEGLQAQDFAQLFALYNEDPADDPGGAGTGPGADFAVEGLGPQKEDPDGFAGRISFPTPAGQPGVLREDANLLDWGFPRDLDADNTVDALDHATDYRLLPIRVRIEWLGAGGSQSFELLTQLAPR